LKKLIDFALNSLTGKGIKYADIRIGNYESENIVLKNQVAEEVDRGESYGFGIRVLLNGSWGFAASHDVSKKGIERIAEHAVEVAKASAVAKDKKVVLSKADKVVDKYVTPVKKDPFSIPLSEKIRYMLKVEKEMRSIKGVKNTGVDFSATKRHTFFGNTEGTFIEQEITDCGGFLNAVSVRGDEIQQRSFPNSNPGQFETGGYEVFEGLGLLENAQKIAEESMALLSAPECPSKKTALILDGNQLYLQVHESCGHPVELDRVLGMEASFAGTSFLTLDKLGKFKYGSEKVNIVQDGTTPGGLGTFGYDDEGVPAQRSQIIKDGIFVGYLTSRETAPVIGQRSNGTARADSWANIPIIRMTNINLEPGTWDLEDLIADTKDGIFMSTNHEWSIDDKRLNFQFGCEIAWEIKNGKLGRMFKNPNYHDMTPRFWGSCDAVCNSRYWKVWGTPNCGKGEPSQVIQVAHGVSPARFRDVEVGVGK